MSRVCDQCGKRPGTGYNVSHSMRHTKRRFLPNLMFKRLPDTKGVMRKMKVCTGCRRTMAKVA